jgi:hypothetical protein
VVAASREGVSVALVSPYDYVGGMMTGGLSLSDGNQCVRQLMGGLFVEVSVNQRLVLDTGSALRTVTALDFEAGQVVTIRFTNEGTDGFVVVDALQLLDHPKK